MNNAFYMALVFVAGMSWPVQAAVNAELKSRTGQPLASAFVNGGGAAILAGLALLIFGLWAGRLQMPTMNEVQQTPWWAYLGGFFSVLVIVAQASSAAPLGVALLITLFVAGQAVSSLVVDHIGLLGLVPRTITPTRVVAVVVLLGCAALLAFDNRASTPEPDLASASIDK
jgi:transporter family-2 protein